MKEYKTLMNEINDLYNGKPIPIYMIYEHMRIKHRWKKLQTRYWLKYLYQKGFISLIDSLAVKPIKRKHDKIIYEFS